jgi:hypothetical protein
MRRFSLIELYNDEIILLEGDFTVCMMEQLLAEKRGWA